MLGPIITLKTEIQIGDSQRLPTAVIFFYKKGKVNDGQHGI